MYKYPKHQRTKGGTSPKLFPSDVDTVHDTDKEKKTIIVGRGEDHLWAKMMLIQNRHAARSYRVACAVLQVNFRASSYRSLISRFEILDLLLSSPRHANRLWRITLCAVSFM